MLHESLCLPQVEVKPCARRLQMVCFRIDPGGRFMIVSGEKSDTLSNYAIDPSSGALKRIGQYPTGKGSNWVEIVSFD
jgi:6-phosphogluconolactonase (cycloisomerase 2 family)